MDTREDFEAAVKKFRNERPIEWLTAQQALMAILLKAILAKSHPEIAHVATQILSAVPTENELLKHAAVDLMFSALPEANVKAVTDAMPRGYN